MVKIDIRPAKESDLSSILPMWMSLQRLTDGLPPAGFGTPDETVLQSQLKTTLENTFNSEDGLLMVAEADDQLIGCLASYRFEKHGYALSNSAVMFSLWVHPDQRGKGIGRRLVETSSEALKQRGVQSLQVGWHPGNQQATAFWQALGFAGYELVAAKPLAN